MKATDYRINGGWLKPSAARSLASSYGGDLNQAAKTTNTTSNSLLPARDFIATENATDPNFIPALIKASPPNTRVSGSWAIMITPDDDTPIIPMASITNPAVIPFFPEHYNVSVIAFGKRTARELNTGFVSDVGAGLRVPEEEILASVTWDPTNDQPMTSGIFEVTLSGDPNVEPKISSGDWIMLSRYVVHFEPSGNFEAMRQRHKWYRVVNSPTEDRFPMTVRLAGLPWDWTSDEIKSAAKAPGPIILAGWSLMDSTKPTYPLTRTVATIVPDVVHVYQRTMSVN
jgi:hypothetical protein